jgi:hypothetical protein
LVHRDTPVLRRERDRFTNGLTTTGIRTDADRQIGAI